MYSVDDTLIKMWDSIEPPTEEKLGILETLFRTGMPRIS